MSGRRKTTGNLIKLLAFALASVLLTTVVIATHHREEWPSGTTHELALSKGSPVWCGPVR